MSPRIDVIVEKLGRLEKRDHGASGIRDWISPRFGFHKGRKPDVFGANVHRYRALPVRRHEIDALEQSIRASLPADLVDLWMSIGSGVGPYYGLFGPDQVRLGLGDWVAGQTDEPVRSLQVELPFPFEPPARDDDPS